MRLVLLVLSAYFMIATLGGSESAGVAAIVCAYAAGAIRRPGAKP